MRRSLAVAVAALLAGCGGAAETKQPATVESVAVAPAGRPPPGSLAAELSELEGPETGLIMGGGDFGVGQNRVTFLVTRPDGMPVEAAQAHVAVARGGLTGEVVAEGTADLVPMAGHEDPDGGPVVRGIYVVELPFEQAGRYTLGVAPVGAAVQGVASIEVREQTVSPPIGSEAPPSETPTLADGFPGDITTARPPDLELLETSVAEAVEAGDPFVVAFATPAFCRSRTCGPTVQVVDGVRERFEDRGIRFIHVEVYEQNNPDNGLNRWMQEWNLPSEPWVFVVDREGIIRAKFEGFVSEGELEEAIRGSLLAS